MSKDPPFVISNELVGDLNAHSKTTSRTNPFQNKIINPYFVFPLFEMKQHNYFIYITTNPAFTVLYVGVTNNLPARLCEHYLNRGKAKTFAGKYHCYNLLYYEHYHYINQAIARENEIKSWGKRKKLALIKEQNPKFNFCNQEICGQWPPPDDAEIRGAYF